MHNHRREYLASVICFPLRRRKAITGISLLTPELSGKRLQLIAEMLPQTARVAVLANPNNLSHAVFLDETLTAANELRVQIQSLQARNPAEIELAFQEATKQGAQALIVFDDPVIWSHRKQVVASAAKSRLPTMYGYTANSYRKAASFHTAHIVPIFIAVPPRTWTRYSRAPSRRTCQLNGQRGSN